MITQLRVIVSILRIDNKLYITIGCLLITIEEIRLRGEVLAYLEIHL